MKIIKATENYISDISQLYDMGRKILSERGVDQWQDGYPNAQSAADDVESGIAYLLVDSSKDSSPAEYNSSTLPLHIYGVASIAFGHEPTYDLVDGEGWQTGDLPYVFIHRVVVSQDEKGKGLTKAFFDFAEDMAKRQDAASLRCDTHEDNLAMQRAMEKYGFKSRGTIYLEDGSPRIAYEKIL